MGTTIRNVLILFLVLGVVGCGFLAIRDSSWSATYFMAVPILALVSAVAVDSEIALVLAFLGTILGFGAAMASRVHGGSLWILGEIGVLWLGVSAGAYLIKKRREETLAVGQSLEEAERELAQTRRDIVSYQARIAKVREQTDIRTRLARGVGLIGKSLKSSDIEQGLKEAVALMYPQSQVDIVWLSGGRSGSFDPFELWVRDSKRSLVVANIKNDQRFREYFESGGLATSFKSIAVVPFGQGPGREPMGLLKVASPAVGAFHQESLRIFDLYALLGGLAFENASLHQAVEQMAVRDALTGVFTRKIFDERIIQECSQASRYQLTLSLAIFDIDHFKSFNDRFGHQVGDQLLVWVAAILKESVRQVDFLARYGGEEFVFLFPETNKFDAANMMDNLRRRIETGKFRLDSGQELQVTASIGVASFPDETKTPRQLLQAADERLYMAKGSGRNRVVVQ